jgi:hypothetical protein
MCTRCSTQPPSVCSRSLTCTAAPCNNLVEGDTHAHTLCDLQHTDCTAQAPNPANACAQLAVMCCVGAKSNSVAAVVMPPQHHTTEHWRHVNATSQQTHQQRKQQQPLMTEAIPVQHLSLHRTGRHSADPFGSQTRTQAAACCPCSQTVQVRCLNNPHCSTAVQ